MSEISSQSGLIFSVGVCYNFQKELQRAVSKLVAGSVHKNAVPQFRTDSTSGCKNTEQRLI